MRIVDMSAEFHCRINDDLELRQLEQQHAATLFELADGNRVHLRRWMPWVDRTQSIADVNAFIDVTLQQSAENSGYHAGLWFQGELCGVIGHHIIDWANRTTSLGYWLDAAHQGKGIMAMSCRAIVEHDFTELNLHRIIIRCATENLRSRAIPERLGFSFEGVAREAEWLYDHFVDLAVYSKLQSDP
jgi:ribosomal-protein-serine acetyltransferase